MDGPVSRLGVSGVSTAQHASVGDQLSAEAPISQGNTGPKGLFWAHIWRQSALTMCRNHAFV